MDNGILNFRCIRCRLCLNKITIWVRIEWEIYVTSYISQNYAESISLYYRLLYMKLNYITVIIMYLGVYNYDL